MKVNINRLNKVMFLHKIRINNLTINSTNAPEITNKALIISKIAVKDNLNKIMIKIKRKTITTFKFTTHTLKNHHRLLKKMNPSNIILIHLLRYTINKKISIFSKLSRNIRTILRKLRIQKP